MILNEVNVRTMRENGSLYVCLSDLMIHLVGAVENFSDEAKHNVKSEEEILYVTGMIHGLGEMVRFLALAGVEDTIEHDVHDIRDLM